MKVLLLSQWFKPESAFKGLPLAKALCDRGHQVEVLTGFPNYPSGRIYPGYRVRPWQRERFDGIPVIRTALYPSHDRSSIRRIANYLSFAASALAFGSVLVDKPDVIYVYNLITLGMAARAVRLRSKAPIVIDVQDLWPESVSSSRMLGNRWLLGLLNRWSNSEYRRADRLIAQSPGFKRNLMARGVPDDRIDVIYNWCDEAPQEAAAQSVTDDFHFTGRFNVVFAGTMGSVQGLDVVLAAARRLQEQAPEVLFTLVGAGVDRDRLVAASAELPNVQFLPWQKADAIRAIYAKADALLLHLKRDPLFEITVPSKTQAYLHTGKPILCGIAGDAGRLVSEAGAGILFAPGDDAALAKAVIELGRLSPDERAAMGRRGQAFYQANLCFRVGVDHLERSLLRACGHSG